MSEETSSLFSYVITDKLSVLNTEVYQEAKAKIEEIAKNKGKYIIENSHYVFSGKDDPELVKNTEELMRSLPEYDPSIKYSEVKVDDVNNDALSEEKSKSLYSYYYRECPYPAIDLYRIFKLFDITDPCLQHAIKKLMVAGGRVGGKDISQDVTEAIASLVRWQEMRKEEQSY